MLVVADVGALLFFGLGLLDLGPGLIVVAAFIGWLVALAIVRKGRETAIPMARARMAIAASFAGWAVIGGIIVDWLYALSQGGVLGPFEYVAQRYGLVAPLAILAAMAVTVYRTR